MQPSDGSTALSSFAGIPPKTVLTTRRRKRLLIWQRGRQRSMLSEEALGQGPLACGWVKGRLPSQAEEQVQQGKLNMKRKLRSRAFAWASRTLLRRQPLEAAQRDSTAAARQWMHSLVQADPRHQICAFFKAGDERGPLGYLSSIGSRPNGKTVSRFFSVWRPTSADAIRMMVEGKAKGKGLNVKGKSAKSGCLSGFVPFIQIHTEADKRRCGTIPSASRLRVYFRDEAQRDAARLRLEPIRNEMRARAQLAQEALAHEKDALAIGGAGLEDATRETYLTDLRLIMDDDDIDDLESVGLPRANINSHSAAGKGGRDDVGFGLELPERLLWEAYVMRQPISHRPGWETGRPR